MAFRILHLSDIHFGTEEPELVSAVLSSVPIIAPDLIVISGDLTMRGRHHEFRGAKAFLDALPAPYLVIPGNHDIPAFNHFALRVFSPFSRYRKWIRPELHHEFRAPGVSILGLNSAMAFGPWPDWSRGGVSGASRRLAHRFFEETDPDDLRILTIHHPVIGRSNAPKKRHLIEWRELLLETLHHVRADLILGGHFHLAYHGLVKRGAPDPHHFVVVQASTATSHRRKGEANGFNVIDLAPDRQRIVFHQWTGSEFLPWQEAAYQRTLGLWQLVPEVEA